ncbi:MAG TPA: DUF3784 domain-containing protein [Flavobacteriaceae bacterium]|nr:DUF3784 domain-containing protein [Flavobacteriaceae bacterium]
MYVLLGMSLLFVAIGFILTENNAAQLLSGYNTMAKEDREKVDIKGYIPYFKKFHVFLGVSLFVFGTILIYFVHVDVGWVFVAIYPILAYIYFAITSSKFSKGTNTKKDKVAIFILVGVLLFMVGLILYGFKENRLIFDSEKIEFEGSYGETLTTDQIKSIQLVEELPEISIKASGFALGTVKKGYFKTENGEKIKLILNAANKPYLLVTKTNGQKIYYSAKDDSNEAILNELKQALPDIEYKIYINK